MKTRLIRLLLLAMLYAGASQASAGLLVDRAIVMFDPSGERREDVVVINDDPDSRLFVSVEAYEVQRAGTPDERLVPQAKDRAPAFIATPNRLVVPPGGRSIVRLIQVADVVEEERVYRINFRPVERPPEVPAEAGDPSVSSLLDVVIAYQVLAIVQPPAARALPEAVRTGRLATFQNRGTSNYLLTRGRQCHPGAPEDCRELPSRRIYPGNRWDVQLPFDGPFNYTVRTPSGYSVSRFD